MNGENFKRCMDFVFKWEGGLVDDPKDRGGITKYGVSLRAHPKLGREGIKALTKAGAIEIYRKEYWLPTGADALAWPLCLLVFDTAVNRGILIASRYLKAAAATGEKEALKLSESIAKSRKQGYEEIVRKNPSQKRFLKGWMNRLNDLRETAGLEKETR